MATRAGVQVTAEVLAVRIERFGQRGGATLLSWLAEWRASVGLPAAEAGKQWGVTIPSVTAQRIRVNVGAQHVLFFTQEAEDQDWMLVVGLVAGDDTDELTAELDDAGELIDRVDDWHAEIEPRIDQTWIMVDARIAPALLCDDRFVRASAALVQGRLDRDLAHGAWTQRPVVDLVLHPPTLERRSDQDGIERAAQAHAEQVVREWLEMEGCTWERISRWDGFDYQARQGDVDFRVEVKGTTLRQPAHLSFTPNQVARSRGELYCVLAVVHSIEVDDALEATGGELLLIDPWEPTDDELAPVSFRYGITYPDPDEEDDGDVYGAAMDDAALDDAAREDAALDDGGPEDASVAVAALVHDLDRSGPEGGRAGGYVASES